MHKLLVYGTLKVGNGRPVKVVGTLYNLGPYPGFVPEGDTEVEGEILLVNYNTLLQFDQYEGVNQGLYRREKIKTTEGEEVWIYIYNQPLPGTARKIESGVWKGDKL